MEEDPEERILTAHRAITERLQSVILDRIKEKDFAFFERLVIKFLETMGYGSKFKKLNCVTKASGDGGIDGMVYEDPLGFSIIYTQAKRYTSDNIGRPEMQKFIGALACYPSISKALFITTTDFTKGARDAAREQKQAKLVLINGKELARHMVACGLGVTTTQSIDIKALDQDFFTPEGD